MRLRSLAALGVAAFGSLAASAGAQAQPVQAGTLTCEVGSGVGLIVASRKEVTCTFQNAAGQLEVYDGAISKLGVDIGITNTSQIVWTVFGPSTGRPGALAGQYVGGTAQATLGAGVGANGLVGGSRNSFTLQPLSISTQTGLNVAAGAADLTLRFRPDPDRPMRPSRRHRG